MDLAIAVGIGLASLWLLVTLLESIFLERAPEDKPKNKPMSGASKQLLREYNALPEPNRPYADLKSMLIALDVKHGIRNVNRHYTAMLDGFNWHNTSYDGNRLYKCNHNKCAYSEYYAIHEAINAIKTALDEQAHKLAVAGVQADLDQINILTARLREESKLISDVTKELL